MGTSKYTQWKERITNEWLRVKLDLEEIEVYVYRRQLAWIGDICRMPMSRTPRKLLSSWVWGARPVGAPKYTYGKGISAALRYAGIDTNTHRGAKYWPSFAQDEAAWSAMLAGLGGINRALPSEKRGAARGASSPLRAGAAAWAYAPCDCGDSDTRGFICGSSSAESGGNYTSSEEGEGGGSSDSEAAEREEEKVTTAALLAGPRRTYEKRARTQVTKLGEWEKQTTT